MLNSLSSQSLLSLFSNCSEAVSQAATPAAASLFLFLLLLGIGFCHAILPSDSGESKRRRKRSRRNSLGGQARLSSFPRCHPLCFCSLYRALRIAVVRFMSVVVDEVVVFYGSIFCGSVAIQSQRVPSSLGKCVSMSRRFASLCSELYNWTIIITSMWRSVSLCFSLLWVM